MTGVEGKANSRKLLAKATEVCVAAAALLLLSAVAVSAFDGRIREGRSQDPQTQNPQGQRPADQDAQVLEAQASPGQAANTEPQQSANPAPSAEPPGPLDAVGRWIGNAGAGISAAWQGTVGGFSGISGQAGSAAKGAADAATNVAKGAADVAKGAADVATTAAKETAGAVTRLPTSRIASGRERCGVAPNGAPDCRVAADALCKSKGFNSGTSVDFENVENCPATVLLAGRAPSERNCPVDYFVTRSLCQ